MSNAQQLILAGIAFLSGFVICGVLTLVPGFLPDVPNQRSLHDKSIPRGGGIGFFLPSVLVLLIALWQADALLPGPLVGLIAGAVVIGVLGLLDDAYRLSAAIRLAVQAVAAGIVAWLFLPASFSILGLFRLAGIPAHAAQVFWILACINLYNFMDGIDGLAGIQGFWASTVLTALLVLDPGSGPTALRVFLGATSASVCGFLIWNLPPARIFMGDVGSYFLGCILAFAPLVMFPIDLSAGIDFTGGGGRPHLLNIVSTCCTLLPFLIDSTTTLLRRIGTGFNPFHAHREHVYQKLVRAGWPVGRVNLFYLGLNLLALIPIAAQILGARPLDVLLTFVLVTLAGFVLFFSLSKALDSKLQKR